ncbi:beta strand repeat-containing protein [Deinococcus roseus]|uniref:DUF11 domain-containing protein n=1 Tax=Deinococcus roseus TaxID=392414 RepID=A0ABQ2DEQ7_9DEIO|nr:DUF11 domain-containing protein [Deinococcus roseus]GGJ54246.1 hypothetical protein GCM10008938_45410 [Deinococcus roseus]
MNKKLLISTALLLAAAAQAKGTLAGTEIRNVASASYVDDQGRAQSTISNQVITVVQELPSFSITPDEATAAATPAQQKSALAGQEVYFPYTVTNTGNANISVSFSMNDLTGDSGNFSSKKLYLDANQNGLVDSGETEITASSISLAADEVVKLVAAVTTPGTLVNTNTVDLNLVGTGSTVASGSFAEAGSGAALLNTVRVNVTTKAVLTFNKTASGPTYIKEGDTIVYTLKGTNNGGSAAASVANVIPGKNGIFISDTLPTNTVLDTTYTPNASAGAGAVTVYYYVGSAWTTTISASATRVGLLIENVNHATAPGFFPQTAQYSLDFRVTVTDGNAATAIPANTNINNTGTLTVDIDNDGGTDNFTSNQTTNTISTIYAIAAGKDNGSGKATDGLTGDTITAAGTVYQGSVLTFNVKVTNNGNISDSFTLALSGLSDLQNCLLYYADGITPLPNTFGPLASGATQDIVVKCQVPTSATVGNVPSLKLTATSVGNPSGNDATLNDGVDSVTLQGTAIQSGYAMDADATPTNGADADPANDTAPTQNVNPGASVTYGFSVTNNGQQNDTYNLTPNLTAFPGYTATIYQWNDTNSNGVVDAGEVGVAVNSTPIMNPATTTKYVVVLTPPYGDVPGVDNIPVVVSSNSSAGLSDTMTFPVNVNAVNSVQLLPDRSGTVGAPGTIEYTHTVTNTGNASAIIDVASMTSGKGFTYLISTDGGTTFAVNPDPFLLAAGTNKTIVVRVIVPAGTAIGTAETLAVTAGVDYNNTVLASYTQDATVTANDTTTVIGGNLKVSKVVDKGTAKPGDTLTYTISSQNIGTQPISKVIVSDPTPNYTDFLSLDIDTATIAKNKVLVSRDGGATWVTWATADANSDGVISAAEWGSNRTVFVAFDTNGDGTITNTDYLAPSATVSVIFKVKVQ